MVICEKYLLTHSLQNGSFSMCFTYWGGSDSKSICLQWGRPGFDPLFRKKPCTRKWHPTPVLLPGKSHGWRNLVGYSPWGRKESDMTEWLHFLSFFLSFPVEKPQSQKTLKKKKKTPHRDLHLPNNRPAHILLMDWTSECTHAPLTADTISRISIVMLHLFCK